MDSDSIRRLPSAANPPATVEDLTAPERPIEQFEVDEQQPGDADNEDGIEYPSGAKLWLTMISLCLASFLSGLDLTIVAVSVPSLTNQFKTVADIGWYSAAYGMTMSAFMFFFGQIYTVFSTKKVFIVGLVIFEAGSLLCTLAPSSNFFILGRAISGLGRAAINGGNFKLLRQCYPLQKQALVTSLVGAIQSLGLVMGPLIGGLLIDAFSWRACYGMNLPLGVICIGLTAYGFQNPTENPETNLPFREKLKRISFLGTLLAVPSITCLLIALQWGGAKYGWGSWRIILLLVVSVTLFVLFGYLQHRQGEKAMLPPRILKQRSIIAGMWYSACLEGILAVTEYYLSIYFQGIKGYTAAQSGLLTLPMIIGLAVAFVLSGFGITATGHYYPFMFATSILAPIASGLLTTINLEEEIVKVALLLGLLGVAVGMGMQGPSIAMQAALPIKDISIGGAVLGFGSGLGSSMWVCVSATLFQSRLEKEIATYSPSTNVTALQSAGLSGLRDYIGPQKLGKVLAGYDKAVDQTLYIPLALGVLTVIGSLATERRSIKKKRS